MSRWISGYRSSSHRFFQRRTKKTESWDSCLWETRSDTENHGKMWWDFRDENCPPEQFRLSKILPCLFAMRRSGSQGVWKFAVAKFDEYLHRLKVSKNYMSKQLSKRRLVQKLLANMSVLFLFTLLFDPWRKWILLKIEGMIFSHLAISVEEVKKFLPHSCVGIDTSTFTKRKEDHFLYWDLNSFAENPDWFCVIPCLVVFFPWFHIFQPLCYGHVTLVHWEKPTARCWKWLLHRFVPCSTDSLVTPWRCFVYHLSDRNSEHSNCHCYTEPFQIWMNVATPKSWNHWCVLTKSLDHESFRRCCGVRSKKYVIF